MRRNNNKQHGAFRQTLIDFIQKYNIKQVVAKDAELWKKRQRVQIICQTIWI